jgi:prophage regulatory protein
MNPAIPKTLPIEQTTEVARLLQEALVLLGLFPTHAGHPAAHLRTPDRLVRLPEVERLTGLRKSAIYDQMKKGNFPRSVKCATRAAVWSEAAIQSWIAARVAGEEWGRLGQ